MWRKGNAGAPNAFTAIIALRDWGRCPGGCNGPLRAQRGPAVEEIWYSIGAVNYHNRATAAKMLLRYFITCAVPFSLPRDKRP